MSNSEPPKKLPGVHRRNGRPEQCPIPHLGPAPPDKRAVGRMARSEANKELAFIYQATKKAEEMKDIVVAARYAGDQETRDAVVQALRGLATAATV